jgi:hypothetical protein
MPIAETVVTLANCVLRARSPLSDWERSLYDVLLQMPRFRDRREVDLWEHQFRETWRMGADSVENPDGYFATSHLLGEIFELGCYNLYTAFDASGTRGELNSLVRCFNVHHNIETPADLDVSEW